VGFPSNPEDTNLEGLRVLVVEDDDDARYFLTLVLSQFGAVVKGAGSASEAMEILSAFKPDVLVSDIGMPFENGYSLIRRIRGLKPEQGSRTPAVAVTAFVTPDDRARALNAGFQVHVSKPIHPEELARIVASLAGRHDEAAAA